MTNKTKSSLMSCAIRRDDKAIGHDINEDPGGRTRDWVKCMATVL